MPEGPIEGFMLELSSGHIFDVKGLIHPPGRVLAYPRYVLDPSGPRRRAGRSFRKLSSWAERMAFLREHFSSYLTFDPVLGDVFCEVPLADVARVLDPVEGLQELSRSPRPGLATLALEMAEELGERARLSGREIGVSGSLLVGLEGPSSDIDLVIYGREACLRAYRALRAMREEGATEPLGPGELEAIWSARSKDTPYEARDFFSREPRKILQGLFRGRPYSIRLVPSGRPEPYGVRRFRPLGTAVIRARVEDASESIFTPCRYLIRDVEVLTGPEEPIPGVLASFRMRFCEHLREEEAFEARGKLELVLGPGGLEEARLLVGGRPGDYIRPLGAPRP